MSQFTHDCESIVSRLRDDAALWYSHDGVRTGRRGRPRIKGEKINFYNLDLSRCEKLDVDDGEAYAIKAYSKALKRNIKIVVYYPNAGSHKIYFSTDLEMSARDIVEYSALASTLSFVSGMASSLPVSTTVRLEAGTNSTSHSTHRSRRSMLPRSFAGNTTRHFPSDC